MPTRQDWVKAAYAGGVPMGGDLPPLGEAKAPSFVVWAVKDPTSGNLDRIQIVKGWSKNGQSFEKIFDVAWAGDRTPDQLTGDVPAIGSTVDITDASYTNTIGAVELKGSWTDPEFDPSLDAFYYARALEIPTPRWTTIQAKQLGIAPPDNVAATIQERAWSSPIWYTPTQEQRTAAAKGTTVADLKAQGATALDNAALTDLIVGKSTWVRNNVTGEVFNIQWSPSGQRLIANVNGVIPKPSEVGDVFHGGLTGQALPTRSRMARSSPPWAMPPTRRPSTSSATSISARAATSSATPTTRWSRHRRRLIPWISRSRRSRRRARTGPPGDKAGRIKLPQAAGLTKGKPDASEIIVTASNCPSALRPRHADAHFRRRSSSMCDLFHRGRDYPRTKTGRGRSGGARRPAGRPRAVSRYQGDQGGCRGRRGHNGTRPVGPDDRSRDVQDGLTPGEKVPTALAGKPLLLVRDAVSEKWASIGAIDADYAGWLRDLAATNHGGTARHARISLLPTLTGSSLTDAEWRERVAVVAPHLESS